MISSKAIPIDLTHTISSQIPTWDGTCGFEQQIVIDYTDCSTKTKFRVQKLCMVAGIGTHLDAPAHCIAGAQTADKISLSALCAPCIVIDVRAKANAHYTISVQDIEEFEHKYGAIQRNTLVAFNTGWDTYWHDPQAYRNNHLFPSIAPQAAELLVKRAIAGVAIDTLGVDRPQNDYPVHQILLGAGIYIVENATNLDKLPPIGSYTFALPIKVAHSTEVPIRFIGIVQ